jgi:hypothetical protein
MAGNRHRHGKGWPNYGKQVTKGPVPNYAKLRKRGPAQTPKRESLGELVAGITSANCHEEAI